MRTPEQTPTATTWYIIKHRKKQICPNNLQLAYFNHQKTTVIKQINVFHRQKMALLTYATKIYQPSTKHYH